MKQGIITIKTDFVSNLKKLIYLFLIVDASFFGIFPINSNDVRSIRTGIAIIAIIICLLIVLNTPIYKHINKFEFVKWYILINMFVVIIQCIYSMNKYNETIVDVFIVCHSYILMLLIFPIMLVFQTSGESFEKMNRNIYYCGVFSVISLIVCAVMYEIGLTPLMAGFSPIGIRDGHTRISYTNIGIFSILMSVHFLLNGKKKEKKWYIAYLIIALFGLIYFVNTRMLIIAIICSIIIMFMCYNWKFDVKILLIIILLVVVTGLAINGGFMAVVNSFSLEGENMGSTLARINAIEYFRQYTNENPLLGMGFVRPYREDLTLIWSGPDGKAFFDDLGLLGAFFRMGITGLIIHILPLLRMLYIAFKLIKMKNEKGVIASGIVAYLVISQVSLNYLDFQRALIAPWYWGSLEYIFYKQKKEKGLCI